MKKMIAILAALALMCACWAATADEKIPEWNSMPGVVIEDDTTTVEESAFAGEWGLNAAFFNEKYVSPEDLINTYNFDYYIPCKIADGKISQEIQQDNGEFVTVETPYTFEAGQLQGTDSKGRDFAVELLEDGNIVMSVFYPGEGDTLTCLTVFLTHPAE